MPCHARSSLHSIMLVTLGLAATATGAVTASAVAPRLPGCFIDSREKRQLPHQARLIQNFKSYNTTRFFYQLRAFITSRQL